MSFYLKYSCYFFFLFASMTAYSQHFTELEGRVTSNDNDVAGTHVLNITTNRATSTDNNGFFTIPVRLNDTLVFSAVQFMRKEIVVNLSVLESKMLYVPLVDALTELDEVIVMPYNLSGELGRDMGNKKIEPVVTASTLGLPNAYVKVKTQNERMLLESKDGKYIKPANDTIGYVTGIVINIKRILNDLSGRTKELKNNIARDEKIALLQKVRDFYPDSVFLQEFKIPVDQLNEFMYFCEVDSLFEPTAKSNDQLRMWEFFKSKSVIYRKSSSPAE